MPKRHYFQRSAGFLATVLAENHCMAWNRQCFASYHSILRHSSSGTQSSTIFQLAANANDDGERKDLQSENDTEINQPSAEKFSSITSREENFSNGILLDPETYLQADSLIQPDGSLNLEHYSKKSETRNPLYQSAAAQLFSNSSYSLVEDEIDSTLKDSSSQEQLSENELLLRAMRNINSNPQRIDPETLHQQVFQEEQTYLQQSTEFRNSLTTLYDDGTETPMAKSRREAIEAYNDHVLENLMKEIDEIEKSAPTKKEALQQAKSASPMNGHIFCSKCGCKVTPDVIERFQQMKEATKRKGNTNKKQRIQKVEMLCDACYGVKFQSIDEAKTRLGVGNYKDGASGSMYYNNKKVKTRRENNSQDKRRGRVDTKPMFQMPQDLRLPRNIDSETAALQVGESMVRSDDSQVQITEITSELLQPAKPRIRELGSRELTRRMQQRKYDLNSKIVEEQIASNQNKTIMNQIAAAKASETDKEWTQVIDPKSQRMFYWNKSSGEMRKSHPE